MSAFVIGFTIAGSAQVRAQSLAEVARQSEERRKGNKEPAKVYTNNDLNGAAEVVVPPPPSDSAKSDDAAGKAIKGSDKDQKIKDKSKDQAYWADRKKQLQAQTDRDQTYLDALQSRINALTADFAARSDPVQRSGIERDRQKAITELERLKKTAEDGKKAIAELEDEARRAGVPPGWLR